MRIGLDYEGVISCDINAWADFINKSSHSFYLVSHTIADWDTLKRDDFARLCPIVNLTFRHDPTEESYIRNRKAELVNQNDIQLFIDDDEARAETVSKLCPNCRAVAIPSHRWQDAIKLIQGIKE